MRFKASRTLARSLGVQTKLGYNPAHITTDNYSFKSLVYGYIQSKGSAKVIAKAGTKSVGICKKLGKGKFYFFTYDIAASGEPGRLSFIKDILVENNITTPVSCSEPDVEVVIQTNVNGAVLYIINGGLAQANNDITKKVVVAVDLSQVGFRQAKVVLHDIFDQEGKIETTSLNLREGLIFEMSHLDARVYWIPKK
jgi:hypothetical protein